MTSNAYSVRPNRGAIRNYWRRFRSDDVHK